MCPIITTVIATGVAVTENFTVHVCFIVRYERKEIMCPVTTQTKASIKFQPCCMQQMEFKSRHV